MSSEQSHEDANFALHLHDIYIDRHTYIITYTCTYKTWEICVINIATLTRLYLQPTKVIHVARELKRYMIIKFLGNKCMYVFNS